MYTAVGISYRDIPIADCNVKGKHNKKELRKIDNYTKDIWVKIKQVSFNFTETFLEEYMNNNVEKL